MFVGLALAGGLPDQWAGLARATPLSAVAPLRASAVGAQQARQRSPAAQQAQQPSPLTLQRQAAGGITLDFETGDLRGWTTSGTAFNAQPTLGDNSRARGGQPANHQGEFWVGTFENHPRGSEQAGASQGDRPQGTLTSTAFDIPRGTLSFLVGGGSSFETRVELQVLDPIEGTIRVAFVSGGNSETMRRQTWELDRWTGQRAQIRIVDESSGPWGHINVDDFRFSALGRPQPGPNQGGDRPPQLIAVPDVVGRDTRAALEILKAGGLEGRLIDRREARQPAGTVVTQLPTAGERVAPGSVVELVEAIPVMAVVPSLVGRDEAVARRLLAEAGLAARRVSRRESPEAPGSVLAQSVAAGTRLEQGSSIDFDVAVPPQVERTRVPDLVGRDIEAAAKILAELRLEIGEVRRETSVRPSGVVLRQDPPASTVVVVGSAVNVSVAVPNPPPNQGGDRPPELIAVPDVVGRDTRAALEILKAGGLEGRLIDRRETRQPAGTVVTQLPTAGERVAPGSVVELVEAIPVMAVVPSLVGRNEAVARRLLAEAGLAAGRVSRRESPEAPGSVLAQSVAPGTRLEQGSRIDFDVAVPVMRTVPDLIGQPEQEARRRIEAAELAVGTVAEAESRREQGIVVSQSERAGSRVVLGTTIDLVVTIPTTVEVPDLRGRSRQEARGLLEGRELTLGNVATREAREPVGSVLSQQPAAGSRAEIDSAVDVVVAEPVTVLVPDVVGRGEGEARQQLGDFELAVGSTTRRESRQQTGTVLEQGIESGARVAIGTPVDLLIAAPVTVVVPEVVGRREDDAAAAIEAAELVVGETEYQESAARPRTVLTQSLNPGTRVQIGSAVNLLVAVVETVPVPLVVGSSVEEARRALIAGRLTVGAEELRETRAETEGTVLEQSRAAGTATAVGTAIGLVVATPEIVVVPSLVGLTEEEAVGVITGLGLVVGAVGEQISAQAGGTVLQQAQPAGSRVVFGTPIALEVARSRAVWALPSALLLLVVAATVAARRRATRRRRSPEPEDTPEETPSPPELRLRPVTDPGRQRLDSGPDPAGGYEIRLRPRVDSGVQKIQSPGDLITGERREDE